MHLCHRSTALPYKAYKSASVPITSHIFLNQQQSGSNVAQAEASSNTALVQRSRSVSLLPAAHLARTSIRMQATTAPAAPAATSGPQEVPAGLQAEADLYAAFCGVAAVSKVTAKTVPQSQGSSNGTQKQSVWITATYSQRNMAGNSQRKYTVQGLLAPGSTQAVTSLPAELPDALLTSSAPKGDKQLVIKAGSENISTVHQVWGGNRLVSELHVPKSQHGGLLVGGYFAPDVAWHPQGAAVAYVAESPPEEKTPAWCGPEAIKDTAAPKSWRGVGLAVEDWGELNTGKRTPAAFILDVLTQSVIKVDAPGLPSDFSWGQPCWAPDGAGLLLVGWPHSAPNFPRMGKKLGVVFCFNRPAQLWYIPLTRAEPAQGAQGPGSLQPGQAVAITKLYGSALGPSFSPSGSQLLYVSHDTAVKTGTHSATAQLCALPWPKAAAGGVEPRVVVDVVSTPQPDVHHGFPGLYTASLPDQAFLSERVVLINSQWRAAAAVLAVDLETGSVTPLTPVASPDASYSLSSVAGGRALAIRVSPSAPPHLVAADLPEDPASLVSGQAGPLNWQPVQGFEAELPPVVAEKLRDLVCEVQQVTPTVGDKSQVFESLVWRPANHTGALPTVITPHGGPHTAFTLGWFPAYAFLSALGYAVVAPNYRGSTGYGQAALQSLPGNIGRHDVDDCMASLQAAAQAGITDLTRVSVVGGSHGGFLTGHLLGQFPDAFKTGVLRNPVCNISAMVSMSDIADWCYVEVWGCEEGMARASAVATPDDTQRMFNMSPIAHVHKVKVPVMLLLGAKDRRVPPPDGLQYQAALRAAGVSVRTVMFPEDSHALDKPQTEFEQWINVAWALKQHS